jgi:hypothetical protein
MEHSPSVAAMRLVEEANERGGRDNITVLISAIRALIPFGEPAEGESADGAGAQKGKKWGGRK